MLAVHDPRARGSSRSRDRSRSRGRDDPEPRSRSRDIRAPSPARQEEPPKRSKKYYESDSEELSEEDPRETRRSKKDKYERSHRTRDDDYENEENSRGYQDSRYDDRYQHAGQYEYARPGEYNDRMRYQKPRDDLAYGDHNDRPRHMPGGFEEDEDDGHRRPKVYQQEQHAPYDPRYPPPNQGPYVANIAGQRPQYQVPQQYQYAQPSQQLQYLPKNRGSKEYVQTGQAQMEVASSKKSRRATEEEENYKFAKKYVEEQEAKRGKKKSKYDDSEGEKPKKKYRDASDDDKKKSKKKYRDDSDDDKKKKKYGDDSDDDKRKKKYRDDTDDDKRKKNYRDDSDDDKKKKKYRDDSGDDKRKKKYRDDSDNGERRKSKYRSDSDEDHKPKKDKKKSEPRYVEIHPGGAAAVAAGAGAYYATSERHDPRHGLQRLSIHDERPQMLSLMAPSSAAGHRDHLHGLPPGSPLLEAYHGTYQSISPMPSPLAMPVGGNEIPSDIEPLDGRDSDDGLVSIGGEPRSILKKRVEIYDPEPDALAIAAELKHNKPGAEPMIRILPSLSDDNILALRTEYKKHFKVNGKGINVAKHIKLKMGTTSVGKAAYATALGRWESEAYWANFWYQSNTSRRELLIESLLGRSNLEIRKIKESFHDKRYNDSLEDCMKAELKKDKFRHAVLLALEEKRQDALERLTMPKIERDVLDLYKALLAGSETAMIEIIVLRSDTHLRQVLQEFERRYKLNFPREMIKKSQNLAGEVMAHILNGVLNRPVRDALLLHQAINETAKDRAELLVSRLVRAHWEPKHLERIKVEYKRRYGTRLEQDVANGAKGEFQQFCVALCAGAIR